MRDTCRHGLMKEHCEDERPLAVIGEAELKALRAEVERLKAAAIPPTYHEGHECCRKCTAQVKALTGALKSVLGIGPIIDDDGECYYCGAWDQEEYEVETDPDKHKPTCAWARATKLLPAPPPDGDDGEGRL